MCPTTIPNFIVTHSAGQENAHLLWNPKVHYCVHNSLPVNPNLSQLNPVHILKSYFCPNINITQSCDSSVSIALGYRLDNQGSRVRFLAGAGNFLFTIASRMALWPTQPPVQWVPGPPSLGIKQPRHVADHSPPSSAKAKEWVELYIHSPSTPSWCGAYLKHMDDFTFTFLPSQLCNFLHPPDTPSLLSPNTCILATVIYQLSLRNTKIQRGAHTLYGKSDNNLLKHITNIPLHIWNAMF
jgi:hypothetical protein